MRYNESTWKTMNQLEEAQFERSLADAIEEARKYKYIPNRFIALINKKGAFRAVKDIVASGMASEGFDKLVLYGRTDLTCEAIIVETRWRQFFDEDLLEIAERRLTTYNYSWKRYEPKESSGTDTHALDQPNEAPALERNDAGDDFIPSEKDQREREVRDVVLRQGQSSFRDMLIDAYGARCCITGTTISEALQAAHICAYRGDASNHIQNGLLLRADLHCLFDRYLFSIHPELLTLELSAPLKKYAAYKSLDHTKLDFGRATVRPSQRALAVHWKAFNET